MTKARKVDCILFGLGTFFLALGLALGIIWPYICDQLSKEKLQLDKKSINYKLWLHTPIPMYLEVYMFNFTNSKEFLKNKSVIPNFEEIGPFVFQEVHDRVNLTWNDDYTVTYNQTRTWTFHPEMSPSLTTKITNLNVVVATVGYMTRTGKWYDRFVNWLINFEEQFIVTKPASEWLFDGIDDKLLDIMNTLKNVTKIPIPYKKFAWFYGRNLSASYDGVFRMNTGTDDIYRLGNIVEWNHMKKTDYYQDDCAVVNGTSGEIFPPMKNLQETVSLFVPDVCSTISLKYVEPTSVEGLSGYKYIGDSSVFDNGTVYPEKKCFCTGECVPSGARNISSCRFGAPVFVSYPHFYLGDKSYLNAVTGMKPNKTEHEFILKVDPVTGIPLEVRAQLQINLLIQPYSRYSMFKQIPKMFVPMMWFRQRARITPDLASQGSLLHILPVAGLCLFYALAGIGLTIIIVRFTVLLLKRSPKDPEMEPVISPADEDENNVS